MAVVFALAGPDLGSEPKSHKLLLPSPGSTVLAASAIRRREHRKLLCLVGC